MAFIPPPAVPFAQGQDVARLRASINKDTRNVKYYTVQYEDRRKFVHEFGAASTNEAKKMQHVHSDLLDQRERRLDALVSGRQSR